MLNPLWPGLKLVMAGTSAEVPLPPDHETRLGLEILKRDSFLFQIRDESELSGLDH